MSHLMPSPRMKFYDANGNPLASGKLYTYQAGTATPLATYTDQSEGGTNANPVVLDSNGEAVIWLGANSYKLVLKDSLGNTLWTADNVAAINDGAVTTAKIADGALSANAAGRGKMADGFLTGAKLADGALSADATGQAKMADNFLTANSAGRAKMQDGFFAADAASRAKFADGFMNKAKLAALGQQISSSCGAFSTALGSYTDVTNLAVTLTTTGRPVFLGLVSDGSGSSSSCVSVTNTGVTSVSAFLRFYETTAPLEVADCQLKLLDVGAAASLTLNVQPNFYHIYVPNAGTYTWKVQAKTQSSATILVNNLKLVAFEL